jgi:hypothetical protein
MMNEKSNYDLLIGKLDQFTRKFYLNQIIRGLLYSVAILVAMFILFSVLEHYLYFEKNVRKLIFFGYIASALSVLGLFVFKPLLNYFQLGSRISHEKAAAIIGDHFVDVKDKLLNILQLKKQSESGKSHDLINASINQKSDEIKLVPFKSAIDLSKNKKYLRYALPPSLVLLVMLFAAPSLIKDSTHRIINNDKEFEKAAPFHFTIHNTDLDVVQYDNKMISVEVDGSVIPDEVFIDVDNFQYRMKQETGNTYSYTFKNVQKNTEFEFFSGAVRSKEHELNVLMKPKLTNFDLYLDYPSYTGRKDEKVDNIGDVLIPQGTQVTWNFDTENTDAIDVLFASQSERTAAERKSDMRYRLSKRIMKDEIYKVYYSNTLIPSPDSVTYALNVTTDKYPEISVKSFNDSLENNLIYFIGNASDDYGLTSVNFNYTVTKANGVQENKKETLRNPKSREEQFDYTFDINTLKLQPGERISYYFETYDNDAVNGSKSSKTSIMEFEKPSVEEFEEQEDANEEEIKDKLQKAAEESKKIQEELQKLREKMLQKQEPNWEDKKELEKLLERQKKLEEQLKEAKEKFDENLKNQDEFSERKEEILEKQEKLQELFEEAMDTETQELMEKIQELMEELNKEQMIEQMEQMEMNDESIEKDVERLEELFKTLELEKEMEDMIEKLDELAEEQEDLSEETAKDEKSKEELAKEQEKINEEFEKLQEKMEELEEKNEKLDKPKDLGEDNQEKMEDIQEDMEDSKEKLDQGEKKDASQKQKQASEKMKQMSQGMQSSMESGQMEQMQEDIAALRQLLENLVNLSFDQERLINSIRRSQINTPAYVGHIQQQFKLKDDFVMIQDSLQELAKRNDKIESFVTEKVVEVKANMSESLEQLEARQKDFANENQRHTMKNVNDLALMLAESMEQMQQQMSGMMSGSQMCDKPGGQSSGKVPMDKISEGQEGLGKQMQKMADGQKNGKGNSAKDFAEAAAKQAALRKALESMQQEKMEQGKGDKQLQGIIDEMDKIEIDLVNKRLDAEMLKRHSDIVTRLLEAEKADREREKDNKRKANTGEEKPKELPIALQEYLKEKEAEVEMYKKVSPSLKPFYKQLVDEYYKALKTQ